ncbi:MAG: glycosyltransferase family protein [Lachnospiraceae bacterium]
MRVNRRKFAFIICVNNQQYFKECEVYIQRLKIPAGFTIEIIPIYDAKSICEGYNRGMTSTDAKYKIYMHQDVYIMNPNFLCDILTVFKQNWKIGMIGMVGSPILPPNAVMWDDVRVGNLYSFRNQDVDFDGYEYRKEEGYDVVEAVDGLLMVTKADIRWRDDLFDGWDFYDISQSFEFRNKGYQVVVPEQRKPWCAHEDGVILNLWNGYDKYRHIFMDNYKLTE